MWFLILIIILGFVISIIQAQSHERKINERIESIGGRVISIEKKHFSIGPFKLVGKGRFVYRIEYRIGDDYREGWVRFGGLFGTDWRL